MQFDLSIKKENLIEILLTIDYVYLKDESKMKRLKFSMVGYISHFKYESFSKNIKKSDNSILIKKDLLETLLDLTISTSQGYQLASVKCQYNS